MRLPRPRSAASVDFYAPPELLILVADELDDLVVGRNLLIHTKRNGLRVRLWIVERDVDFQLAVAWPADPLRKLRLLRVRAAADVEPSIVGTRLGSSQVVRLDDQRVAVPSPYRISIPERLDAALRRQRTPIEIDIAKPVVRFVHDRNYAGALHDLPRLAVHVELGQTHRQAIRVGVVNHVRRHALLLQLGGP